MAGWSPHSYSIDGTQLSEVIGTNGSADPSEDRGNRLERATGCHRPLMVGFFYFFYFPGFISKTVLLFIKLKERERENKRETGWDRGWNGGLSKTVYVRERDAFERERRIK